MYASYIYIYIYTYISWNRHMQYVNVYAGYKNKCA